MLQWKGIRGGTREVTFRNGSTFSVEVEISVKDKGKEHKATYRIEVDRGGPDKPPRVEAERLVVEGRGQCVFDSHPNGTPAGEADSIHIPVMVRKEAKQGFSGPPFKFLNNQPVLAQIPDLAELKLPTAKELAKLVLAEIASMRFLDLDADAMRMPSFPGQKVLGDRGENLSSVLQAICQDEDRKRALVQWVRELTPMDAVDFRFEPDQTGRILVYLTEENQWKTSGYSASDGTLRFLAMLAVLLGPEPSRFYFFEELENGIHPSRLYLLLQLIERKVWQGNFQMVATSHSPQLLRFLNAESLEHALLVYRSTESADSVVVRIMDLPKARGIIETKGIDRLYASGWLEDVGYFLNDEDTLP